jgi:uncharacterized coiled-coil DUF342 family protein
MGRTILSATQTWVEEDKALMRFVRALRKNDQVLIEELIALSRKHIAEASYASNLYPMDIYLTSMLLELYKKVRQLEIKVENMDLRADGDGQITQEVRGISSLLELVRHEVVPSEKKKEADAENSTVYIDFQDGA